MKLIIAGGRKYEFSLDDLDMLDRIIDSHGVSEVVSGKCSGADRQGELWAEFRAIPVKLFPADWDKFPRAAGPIRNKEMAEYADAVALFPGGAGTGSMHNEAKKAGLIIFDFRNNNE